MPLSIVGGGSFRKVNPQLSQAVESLKLICQTLNRAPDRWWLSPATVRCIEKMHKAAVLAGGGDVEDSDDVGDDDHGSYDDSGRCGGRTKHDVNDDDDDNDDDSGHVPESEMIDLQAIAPIQVGGGGCDDDDNDDDDDDDANDGDIKSNMDVSDDESVWES